MAFRRKVHVTGQTLELLHGEFEFENGTVSARNDAFLIKNNIQTYLISPPKLSKDDVNSSRQDFIVIENLSAYDFVRRR